MKLLLLTLIIASATNADKNCTGVNFNNRYYEIQILKEGLNKIQQLILNRNDNTLYFIFDQIENSRAVGYLNIDTMESSFVDGIRNASAIAIDYMNNKVYIGSTDGVYTVDNVKKIPTALPIRDDIQSVFFKDFLFYTNGRKEAYVFHHERISPVTELQGYRPDKLILDDDNNILFTQGTTLFRVKLGTRAVNTHEKYRVDLIATDHYYKPYICTKDGIYVYNKYKYVLDKVSSLTYLRGLAFDKNDNPIYAVLDLVIKLNNPAISNLCYEF